MNETAYREAERRLWSEAGATPSEQRVRTRSGNEIRVQELGDGPPVLLIHGGPNSGSTWAFFAARMEGFRTIMVDRPGTGLSDPIRLDASNVAGFADSFVPEVLDALGLDRAHVVASSFGGYIALRSAAAHPDRFDRMVQMACPAFVPGMKPIPFMRILMTPGMNRVIGALPPNMRTVRSVMKQIGHGKSLAAGKIPAVFLEWYLALQKHTDTMPNEGRMIATMGSPRGFSPALTLSEGLLSSVKVPALFLWGEDDPFGGADVARTVAGLLPDADLRLWPDSGHLPWIDDPARAARETAEFLRR